MPFVSITRLRIRSWRFMPGFLNHMWRSIAQAKRADGFRNGALLADRSRTFWTMTLWDSETAMRRYMVAGAHLKAMPRLLDWCDEASVVHWQQDDTALPCWQVVDQHMRRDGRPSKVRRPGPDHAGQTYPPPRVSGAVAILPVPHD